MAIPVKFYSLTQEQFERMLQQSEQDADGSEESQKRRQDLEGGIFFVGDNLETHKS